MLCRVPVQDLVDLIGSPWTRKPWGTPLLTDAGIQASLAAGRLNPVCNDTLGWDQINNKTETWDTERVAYLVQNPATDAITLDIGTYVRLEDGWHRFSAAIYRKQAWITADVYGMIDDLPVHLPRAYVLSNLYLDPSQQAAFLKRLCFA